MHGKFNCIIVNFDRTPHGIMCHWIGFQYETIFGAMFQKIKVDLTQKKKTDKNSLATTELSKSVKQM